MENPNPHRTAGRKVGREVSISSSWFSHIAIEASSKPRRAAFSRPARGSLFSLLVLNQYLRSSLCIPRRRMLPRIMTEADRIPSDRLLPN